MGSQFFFIFPHPSVSTFSHYQAFNEIQKLNSDIFSHQLSKISFCPGKYSLKRLTHGSLEVISGQNGSTEKIINKISSSI
jgi:hypothetical protein